MRGFPLERDEGEYAYAGQLILQGIPPYQLEYNMKWPGTYAAYAVVMAIFGQSASGIRIGLVLVTTSSALLVYFLARRFFGPAAGVFGRFWFWTIDYARQYAMSEPLARGIDALRETFGTIIASGPLPWLIALIGAVMLFIDREARQHWKLIAAITLGGVAATIPGLHFREHYFITLFPAVA